MVPVSQVVTPGRRRRISRGVPAPASIAAPLRLAQLPQQPLFFGDFRPKRPALLV